MKDNVYKQPYSYVVEDINTVAQSVKTHAGAGGQWGRKPLYTDVAKYENCAPIVSISAPEDGASFVSPDIITLNAEVADLDGSINQVIYYNGNEKISESNSYPFSINMTNFTSCDYSIVSVAYDHSGNSTMSLPVSFSIVAEPYLTK